jgi:hypothetical protein
VSGPRRERVDFRTFDVTAISRYFPEFDRELPPGKPEQSVKERGHPAIRAALFLSSALIARPLNHARTMSQQNPRGGRSTQED